MLAIELQNSLNQARKTKGTTQVMRHSTDRNYLPSVNQQIQVLVPCEGTQQLSNWNDQENSNSTISSHTACVNQEMGPINITTETIKATCSTSTSDASPFKTTPRARPTAQTSCLDILARAALSENDILPGCEEDEYYSD